MRSVVCAGALTVLAGCHAERILGFVSASDAGGNSGDATGDASDATGTSSDGGSFGPAQVVTGLRGDTSDVFDPSMTHEELDLYFTSPTGGLNDIWVARRALTSDPWGSGALVAELSSPQNDQDPEVSVDGLNMFFADPMADNMGDYNKIPWRLGLLTQTQ